MLHPDVFFPSEDDSWTSMYTVIKLLGQGTFGMVVLASDNNTGEKVAIKRVRLDCHLQNRELSIMKELLSPPGSSIPSPEQRSLSSSQASGSQGSTRPQPTCAIPLLPYHPNIVKLKNSFVVSEHSTGAQFLNIVMSYVPQDLAAMKRSFFSSPETPVKCSFPVLLTKVVLFQAARALAFLHHKHIVHRDLKPANILIDPDTFRVQLCDLGSAKQIVSPSSAKNVSYICSRYYRAPELLFGSLHYDAEVDLWSLGCIAAEMLRTGGKVLFKGTTTMDQMAEIFKVLGAPSRQEMFLMNPQAAEAMAVTHEHYRNSGSFPSSIQEHSAVMGEEGTTTSTVDEESDYNHNYNVLKISALPMDKVLSQDASASGVQLIQQLLTYAPQKRMTAVQVLQHEFFADLFTDSQKDSEVVRLPNGKPLPVEMFLLTRQETAYLPSALQEKMTREAEKIKETIVRKK